MPALRLATCDRALPPGGDAPEWVHLLPSGHIVARDGREFDLPDPAALVLAFQEHGIDLPVDYEHQSDLPEAKLRGPVPAAGWIKEIAYNEEGVWGRVEWTATAREMIARKEYRFLSPSFFHNKMGQIMRLSGAGLVHKPALHLKALASQEDTIMDKPIKEIPAAPMKRGTAPTSTSSVLMERLFKLLKLPPNATEEEALDALEEWLTQKDDQAAPDPKRFVPVEAVAAMIKETNLEKATLAESHATAKVDAAIRDGVFLPSLRGWALSLCRNDPMAFEEFVAKAGSPFAYLKQQIIHGTPETHARAAKPTEIEAAICAQLGLTPERLSQE